MYDTEIADTLFLSIWHFHIFCQIQLKTFSLSWQACQDSLAKNMLKLTHEKFHMATQPWMKIMTD